jgi:hypothetical protein
VCRKQAIVRVLLTQELYCLKHYVTYLKNGDTQNIEKVNNQKEEQPNEQNQSQIQENNSLHQ